MKTQNATERSATRNPRREGAPMTTTMCCSTKSVLHTQPRHRMNDVPEMMLDDHHSYEIPSDYDGDPDDYVPPPPPRHRPIPE